MTSPAVDVPRTDLDYFIKLVNIIPAYVRFHPNSDTEDEYPAASENNAGPASSEGSETLHPGSCKYYINLQKKSTIPSYKASSTPENITLLRDLNANKEELSATELKQRIARKIDELHSKRSTANKDTPYVRLSTDKTSRSELKRLAILKAQKDAQPSEPKATASNGITRPAKGKTFNYSHQKPIPEKSPVDSSNPQKSSFRSNLTASSKQKDENTVKPVPNNFMPKSKPAVNNSTLNSKQTITESRSNTISNNKKSKFDLSGRSDNQPKVPVKRDLTHALEKLLEKKERLKKLEKSNPKKAKEIVQKSSWDKAIARSQGARILDDPTAIKKSLKRKQQKKVKSAKEWKARLETQDSSKASQAPKRPGFEGVNFKKSKTK